MVEFDVEIIPKDIKKFLDDVMIISSLKLNSYNATISNIS